MRRRRRQSGRAFFIACAGLVACAAAALGPARVADAAPDADLVAALDAAGGADVVALELPRAARTPHVRAATVTGASVGSVARRVSSSLGATRPSCLRSCARR